MPTLTIRLDDETDARLKRRLARSGETVSEFVRSAITSQLDSQPRAETRLASLMPVLDQMTDTGETDPSVTYKVRLKERAMGRHRR